VTWMYSPLCPWSSGMTPKRCRKSARRTSRVHMAARENEWLGGVPAFSSRRRTFKSSIRYKSTSPTRLVISPTENSLPLTRNRRLFLVLKNSQFKGLWLNSCTPSFPSASPNKKRGFPSPASLPWQSNRIDGQPNRQTDRQIPTHQHTYTLTHTHTHTHTQTHTHTHTHTHLNEGLAQIILTI
jgi:hypothetical protein